MPRGRVELKFLAVKRAVRGCEAAGIKIGRVEVEGARVIVYPATADPRADPPEISDGWDEALVKKPVSIRP